MLICYCWSVLDTAFRAKVLAQIVKKILSLFLQSKIFLQHHAIVRMRSKLGTLFMHFGNLKTNHKKTPKNHDFEVDNIGIPDQGLFFREGGFRKGVPLNLKNTDQHLRKSACHRKKHGSSSAAVTPKSSPPKT